MTKSLRTGKKILGVGMNGNMGSAMIKAWIKNDPSLDISIISPNTRREYEGNVSQYSSLDEIVKKEFDVIVFGTKPQKFPEIIPQYKSMFNEGSFAISIAAGISLPIMSNLLGSKVPVVRTMPNLPSKIGLGMTGMVANEYVSEEQKQFANLLMSHCGEVLIVKNDDEIDKVTASAGSGPGFFFSLLDQISKSFEDLGFNKDESRRITLQVMKGTVELAIQEPQKSLEELKKAVVSPNGTTFAGLQNLESINPITKEGVVQGILTQTVKAAYLRSGELAKEAEKKIGIVPNLEVKSANGSILDDTSKHHSID